MCSVQKDLFIFEDGLDGINDTNLPKELRLGDEISYEALLIRLLCGTLKINLPVREGYFEYPQLTNFSVPGTNDNTSFKRKIIKDFFSLDHYRQIEQRAINQYLIVNRKNHYVYRQLLSELTMALIRKENSPIESFVHIYRALEFMSYSFPLIYASKSMDYTGSYNHLKDFMSGESSGELKFFKRFLKVLFKDNLIYDYEFDAFFLNGTEQLIETEFQHVIKANYYLFDGNTMKIKFANVIDLVITIRNHFFHMLIGKGGDNFYDTRYDKRDIFEALNPIFINWLAIIYKEIASYSLGII
ncbi:MAG TPA: hypothetical protein H9921_11100 [Candidatus Mediterraneibacter caccogallinarum]|nr:hypothetical protein [Candidatus Mediterraneibacter caccogallinarum]